MFLRLSITGHGIPPHIVADVSKFSMLATKTQKLMAELATKTIPYIVTLCIVQ